MEQRSEEWFAARLGKVTASRVADVMAKTRSGYAASRQNYMMELLCERLTGAKQDGYVSGPMLRGIELEPVARSAYEIETGLIVIECGFVAHDVIENFGASPDGLVESDGLLEIKCPNTAQHVEFLRTGKPDTKYQWQMLAQMACTDRQWCDFVSYDDRLPEPLAYRCVRFARDEARIAEMTNEIRQFLSELDSLEHEMRARMEKAA